MEAINPFFWSAYSCFHWLLTFEGDKEYFMSENSTSPLRYFRDDVKKARALYETNKFQAESN
jgi:hypothetical protein